MAWGQFIANVILAIHECIVIYKVHTNLPNS